MVPEPSIVLAVSNGATAASGYLTQFAPIIIGVAVIGLGISIGLKLVKRMGRAF